MFYAVSLTDQMHKIYMQNVHQASIDVLMDNASQLAIGVTTILTALMEVMSIIAVSTMLLFC